MKKIFFTFVSLTALLLLVVPAGAQDQAITSIVESIEDSGRYVEADLESSGSAAIDDANSAGIAFVWLERTNQSPNDAPDQAASVRAELAKEGSRYMTVLVLIDDGSDQLGLGAASASGTNTEIKQVIESVAPNFVAGDVGAGVAAFTSTLASQNNGNQMSDGSQRGVESTSSGSGGGGFLGLVLLVGLVGGGSFLTFRFVRGRGKAKKQAEHDMAADRAEIEEQLKNNADRVISLGDKVITSKDDELIRTYEAASSGYQEVSASLPTAQTADAVDALDDKIDKIEWQFDVIEAKLAGEPAPPSPAEQVELQEMEKKVRQGRGPQKLTSSDKPALGANETIFDGRGQTPRPQRQGGLGGSGRGLGGGLGGGLGRGLGSILGSILLGGSMGGRRPSRRSRRRSMGGFGDPFGGAGRSGRRGSGGGGFSRGSRGGGGFSRAGKGGGGFKR